MGRFYDFPSVLHLTDLILLVLSIIIINWKQNKLFENVNQSDSDFELQIVVNMIHELDFMIQYLFAIMISCLVLRIATILQYNEQVGPLIKIVGKMLQDFFNFVVLYFILTIMFALVGNINFLYDVESFNSFFNAVLTVIDACLGNFDFKIFDNVKDPSMQVFGQVYIMLIVIAFNIMLLNLIIAILANTYNIFDTKSNGLYLSKILSTRDELTYDDSYGAFLSAMPPINFI